MKSRLLAAAAASALCLGVLAPTTAASAATPMVKHYKNCSAVHRDYSGGIARAGVNRNKTKHGSSPLKGNVKHSTALYNANKGLDRDKDGVACEKA